jgi:hypothetical protein
MRCCAYADGQMFFVGGEEKQSLLPPALLPLRKSLEELLDKLLEESLEEIPPIMERAGDYRLSNDHFFEDYIGGLYDDDVGFAAELIAYAENVYFDTVVMSQGSSERINNALKPSEENVQNWGERIRSRRNQSNRLKKVFFKTRRRHKVMKY